MEHERENHGGKKNYHTMAALYFYDMAHVFIALRDACKDGSKMCFVIGDSAPYGVYMPVDEWLAKLALSTGFKSWDFDSAPEEERFSLHGRRVRIRQQHQDHQLTCSKKKPFAALCDEGLWSK